MKQETPEWITIHRADARGHANHGWLDSYQTFSFSGFYDPERINFGALRVLNDDRVEPGKGFGRHPHDNMEIVSIPLEGALEHQDSLGNIATIEEGEIQVMSAGTGVFHSEYNKSKEQPVKFLQIWLFPNKKNVTPHYDQYKLRPPVQNEFQQILSPHTDDDGVTVQQDAWFHLGIFEKDVKASYSLKKPGDGVYVFVIAGSVEIAGNILEARDGMGIEDQTTIEMISRSAGTQLLLMEVPMKIA